jgi:hypothetical protein
METLGMRAYSGTYNPQRQLEAEKWLGKKIEWTVLMADRTSPTAMRGSVFGNMKALTKGGKKATNRIVMTVPLGFGRGVTAKNPAGVKAISINLGEVISGRWDADYRAIASRIKDSGYGDAVIRLGHEMNGPWYPWSTRNSAQNVSLYKDAFRHVRTIFDSESTGFRFEWNVISSAFVAHGPEAFPGGDVVDIIGMDIYNKASTGKNPVPYATKWKNKLYPVLVAHREFARKHGRPVSYAEWANGSVDEPGFINDMADWFENLPTVGGGSLLYQSYFNVGQKAYKLDLYPKNKDAYIQRFGKES